MLQASLYAGRQETDCGDVSDTVLAKARRTLSGVDFGVLFAVARKAFSGSQSVPLSDHLLQDIGISRAELEALRF